MAGESARIALITTRKSRNDELLSCLSFDCTVCGSIIVPKGSVKRIVCNDPSDDPDILAVGVWVSRINETNARFTGVTESWSSLLPTLFLEGRRHMWGKEILYEEVRCRDCERLMGLRLLADGEPECVDQGLQRYIEMFYERGPDELLQLHEPRLWHKIQTRLSGVHTLDHMQRNADLRSALAELTQLHNSTKRARAAEHVHDDVNAALLEATELMTYGQVDTAYLDADALAHVPIRNMTTSFVESVFNILNPLEEPFQNSSLFTVRSSILGSLLRESTPGFLPRCAIDVFYCCKLDVTWSFTEDDYQMCIDKASAPFPSSVEDLEALVQCAGTDPAESSPLSLRQLVLQDAHGTRFVCVRPTWELFSYADDRNHALVERSAKKQFNQLTAYLNMCDPAWLPWCLMYTARYQLWTEKDMGHMGTQIAIPVLLVLAESGDAIHHVKTACERLVSDPEVLKTALHSAISLARLHRAQHLLERGADVCAMDESGNTALHAAAYCGSLPMLECILDATIRAGGSLETQNYTGNTPLLLGCVKGAHVIRTLVDAGCSLHVEDVWGNCPLQTCGKADGAGVRELLHAGAEARNMTVDELMQADNERCYEVVQLLLAAGMDMHCHVP